jgi:nitrogen fixation protein FixH
MQRRSCLLLLLLICLIAPACQRKKQPEEWTMSLATEPAVPQVNRDTQFTLHVRRPNGEPVRGAAARISLEMTFMDMGPNVVQLEETQPGAYTGKGRFAMGGDWDCRAMVKLGAEERQQIFHYKIG